MGAPQALNRKCISSLISARTILGSTTFPSKTLLFLSFHMFQAVYMRKADVYLRSFCGCCAKDWHHQSSIVVPCTRTLIKLPDHALTSPHTYIANGQCKHRCSAVSGMQPHKEQSGLHCQFLAWSLSSVNNFSWTSNQLKKLCLPSACAHHIADGRKE